MELLALILQSISFQFQFLATAVCWIAGDGCSLALSMTVYQKEYSRFEALSIAFCIEYLFYLFLIKNEKRSLETLDDPDFENP